MFGLLSKITGFVLGIGDENEAPQEPELAETYILSNSNRANDNHNATKVNSTKATTKPEQLRKSFYGKVTKLYDGAGVIDNDVYFTFDVVLGGFRLELGDEVHAEASRESSTSGWKATRVDRVQVWDPAGQSGTLETFIGMVTKINTDVITLNDELTINMSTLHLGSSLYSPFKGDWVKADLERFADDSVEIRGVKPLREKSFSGKVSSVFPGYGYIDEDVYFTSGACIRGLNPRRGDDVQVTAVESEQGRSKWRAIQVEPKRFLALKHRPSAGSQQFMGGRMAELLSNKQGLAINDPLQFADVFLDNSTTINIEIRNTGEKSHKLLSCSFVRADPQFEILLAGNRVSVDANDGNTKGSWLAAGMDILPQQTGYVLVRLTAKSLGRFKQLIVFTFDGCEIGRYITGNILDTDQTILGPSAPYQRNRIQGQQVWDRFAENSSREGWVIPGERPTRKTKIYLPIKLKMYNIPSDIRRCILQEGDLAAVVPALRESLSMETYQARYSSLLNAEELQMELDMREFDMEQVTMDLCREFLMLRVPGLAEGRPSLLLGDTVVVSLSGSSYDSPKYEGYIHEVRKEDILLRFNDEFHKNFSLEKCDVMFYFNRTSMRRAHQAVEFAVQMGVEVLFPRCLNSKLPVVSLFFDPSSDQTERAIIDKSPIRTQDNPQKVSPRNTTDFLYNSDLNERQRAAVCRILSGQCRPTPYLLFGPPGTGKTVTLVEAILQVFHRVPASRVIACAPSNSAADLLAVRLHRSGFIQEGDMIRLNAFQRAQEIPEVISQYCTDTDSLTLASHYRIIVCTCSTAGQLFSLGLRAGHFTHVFVDEAGQATEPECLVPIGLAAGGEGQIILAGDPFQLGPVLRSQVALSYGLNISLLERLISRPLYTRDEARFSDHGCYDPLLVTKLINNYRSHPTLLRLPSTLFYHSELRVFADKAMREGLSQWEMLPTMGVPLLFHGLKGVDVREGNSPSWFNPAEAVQVVRYVQGLKNSTACPLKITDMGIITPYRKQVEKIRLLLNRLGIEDAKVGSVEEFQGQERLAIIISTVRSNESMVGFDVAHSIGFLSNPKRFNVAITRAQALLIVIGNPHVLCQDPYWCSLLQYCVMNDAYTGCDLPDLDSQAYREEFEFAMEMLNTMSPEGENESKDIAQMSGTSPYDRPLLIQAQNIQGSESGVQIGANTVPTHRESTTRESEPLISSSIHLSHRTNDGNFLACKAIVDTVKEQQNEIPVSFVHSVQKGEASNEGPSTVVRYGENGNITTGTGHENIVNNSASYLPPSKLKKCEGEHRSIRQNTPSLVDSHTTDITTSSKVGDSRTNKDVQCTVMVTNTVSRSQSQVRSSAEYYGSRSHQVEAYATSERQYVGYQATIVAREKVSERGNFTKSDSRKVLNRKSDEDQKQNRGRSKIEGRSGGSSKTREGSKRRTFDMSSTGDNNACASNKTAVIPKLAGVKSEVSRTLAQVPAPQLTAENPSSTKDDSDEEDLEEFLFRPRVT